MSTIDNAFKMFIGAGWANQSDGDVEAPTGFFTIIDCSTERAMLRELLDSDPATFDNDTLDKIPAKWFGTIEDNLGFIHLREFDTESEAVAWFDKRGAEFARWSDETE